jgi:hypothetical protein
MTSFRLLNNEVYKKGYNRFWNFKIRRFTYIITIRFIAKTYLVLTPQVVLLSPQQTFYTIFQER